MQKYIAFILLLTIYIHSAQQKRLISGQWNVIGISGVYNKKQTTDNNSFPFAGDALESSKSILIDDVIDFNSSNNNVYSLFRNSFSLNDVDKYTSTDFLNSRIDVYRMANNGAWEFYSSKNLSSSSNDFTRFEIGKSYWVKATSTRIDNNISIILDNHLSVLEQYSLHNGWNVVALNDDIIEHSASAFFIPSTTTLPLTISRIFNLSPIVTTGANIIEAAQSINHKSFLAKINGEPLHLRAYPARKTNGTEGIIVISNSIMNISSSDALSLSGDIMQNNPNGYKISNIEHIIGFKIDTTIPIAYNSMLEIRDLVGNSGTVVLQNANINNMTNTVVSRAKEVLQTDNVIGYTIMIDFNGTTPVYDNILISSDKPFGIREKFYARKFRYLREGKFFVSGADAQALNTPLDINKFSNFTGITYHDLGANEFEISSNRMDDLDLFKSDSKDLFKKLDNDNKGYITNAYKAINLYGAFIKDNNITPSLANTDNGFIDEVTHINDLSTHIIYSESVNRYRNLQKFFLLNKRFINLYTAEFIGGSLFWRTIDFTKKSNWFDRYDKATLFVTNKELGYYAYLKNRTNNIPTISEPIIKMKVRAHFNSKDTYNFTSYIISFRVNNLSPDKRYAAYMVVSNKIIQMYDNDGVFEVKLDNEFLKLDKDKKYNIAIKIANNTGALIFNQKLSLFYNKPIIKSAEITGNTLSVVTDSDYEVYDEKINEINKKETFLGKNITDLSKIIKKIDYKNIKVVAMDKYGFYSNIYSLGYVPDNEESTLRTDNERRNSITLKVINNSDMTFTFTPIDENKLIKTVVKTMYLKVDFKVIGSVTYDFAHKDNKFFVFYDNKRYEGIFQSNEDYNSDSTAYILKEIE
jgi:hypothetical protein